MSKIQLISDVHTEFIQGRHNQPEDIYQQLVQPEVDLLVIAGDLGAPLDEYKRYKEEAYEQALKYFCDAYPHVMLIPGNHDFYHGSFDRYRRFAKRQRRANLTIQESQFGVEKYKLNDEVNVYGCTLWFKDRPENILHYHEMNDDCYIEDSLNQVCVVGKKQIEDLKKKVKSTDIVVTHHGPSSSIASRYASYDTVRPFYYNEAAEDIINENRPKLWLFGHTHMSEDRMLGETRIISNPMGYYGKALINTGFMSFQNGHFNPALIIEV